MSLFNFSSLDEEEEDAGCVRKDKEEV